MKIRNLKASGRDFTKLNTIGQLGQMPLTRLLKANLYDVEQVQLPMTQAEFNSKFPGTKKVFDLQGDNSCPGRQTNAGTGMTVEAPFLLTGVALIAIAEAQGFALPGVVVNTPAVPEATPCITGCVSDCAGALGERNGVLAWGYPGWNIISKFFQAYRAQMYIGRHFQIFDEAAFDIGLAATTSEFVGASDSLISAMPFVREVNDQMAAKAMGKAFIPPNVAVGANGSECIGAPTAGVTWGATHTPGVANRIYQICTPLLWLPGMTLDLQLVEVENDCCFRSAIERDGVLDPDNPVRPSAAFTEELACGVGCAGTYTVPGGCISIGMVLTGYDVTAAACVEYLSSIPTASALEGLYADVGVGAISALLTNPMLRGQLNGVPEEAIKNAMGRFVR